MKKLDIKIYLLSLVFLSFMNLIFAIRTNSFFSVDDFAVLAYFKDHTVLQMIPDFVINGDIFFFRRLVGFIAFGALFKMFGVNYLAFDISMFLTNTANLVLLFYVVKKISKNNFAAFFVSIIFNKNYLFYYSNLHEHLLATFCLLTIFLFLYFPKKFYLSAITMTLALFTKETAFTVPLILFALSFLYKLDRKKIFYLFLISLCFGIYATFFFVSNKIVHPNFSYTVATSVGDIFKGLLFYIEYKVLILSILLPLITKRIKLLPILAVTLLTLIPASLLVNRREIYYLYMPFAYLMMYISLLLPKVSWKSAALYLVVFLVFGGRSILPKIAWNEFPNWQKVSLCQVLEKASVNDYNFSNMTLERDARLMIESNTTDLFLPNRTKICNL